MPWVQINISSNGFLKKKLRLREVEIDYSLRNKKKKNKKTTAYHGSTRRIFR